MARRYHSPSSAKTIEECPYKAALIYLEGRREPPTAATIFGGAFHRIGEKYYGDGDIPPEEWDSDHGRLYLSASRHLPHPEDCVVIEVEHEIGDDPLPPQRLWRPRANPRGTFGGAFWAYEDDPDPGLEFTVVSPYRIPPHEELEALGIVRKPTTTAHYYGIDWAGFIDLRLEADNHPLIIEGLKFFEWITDYKTTADLVAWAMCPAELERDLQANLYGLWTMDRFDLDEYAERWLYAQTRGKARSAPVDVIATRSRASDIVERYSELCAEFDLIERVKDAPQNRKACGNYGGCKQHVSAGGTCTARRSTGALIQLGTKKRHKAKEKEGTMSEETAEERRERIRKMREAKEKGAAPVTEDKAAPARKPRADKPKGGKSKAVEAVPVATGVGGKVAEIGAKLQEVEADTVNCKERLAELEAERGALVAELKTALG